MFNCTRIKGLTTLFPTYITKLSIFRQMDNKSTSDMRKYSGIRFTSYLRYPLRYGVKTIIFGML